MKKTTYIILSLLSFNFILILAFFIYLKSTERPMQNRIFAEITEEVYNEDDWDEDDSIHIAVNTQEDEELSFPLRTIIIQSNGYQYNFTCSSSEPMTKHPGNDIKLNVDSLGATLYLQL